MLGRLPWVFQVSLVALFIASSGLASPGDSDQAAPTEETTHAAKCPELLLTPTSLDGWIAVYDRAREVDDQDIGGTALLHILRLSGKALGLSWSEKIALRRYAPAAAIYTGKQGALKLYRSLTQKTLRVARGLTGDAFWVALAPTLARIPVVVGELQIAKRGIQSVYRRLGDESFRKRLPIADDAFLAATIEDALSDTKTAAFWMRKGMLAQVGRPLYFSFMLFLGGYHPTSLIKSHVEGHYYITDFLKDAKQAADFSLEGKRVTVLVDKAILPSRKLGVGDSDPLNWIDTTLFSEGAASFHAEPIDTIATLKEKMQEHRDSDVLAVYFHGTPGDFFIDEESVRKHLSQLDLPKLPQGGRILFVSCWLGSEIQQSGDSPLWVEISRRMLPDDGKSIASEQVITYKFAKPLASPMGLFQLCWVQSIDAGQWAYAQGKWGATLVPWRVLAQSLHIFRLY